MLDALASVFFGLVSFELPIPDIFLLAAFATAFYVLTRSEQTAEQEEQRVADMKRAFAKLSRDDRAAKTKLRETQSSLDTARRRARAN